MVYAVSAFSVGNERVRNAIKEGVVDICIPPLVLWGSVFTDGGCIAFCAAGARSSVSMAEKHDDQGNEALLTKGHGEEVVSERVGASTTDENATSVLDVVLTEDLTDLGGGIVDQSLERLEILQNPDVVRENEVEDEGVNGNGIQDRPPVAVENAEARRGRAVQEPRRPVTNHQLQGLPRRRVDDLVVGRGLGGLRHFEDVRLDG